MAKLKQKNSYLNHLIRNQLTSLILHEKIVTTLQKAKRLKPVAEKLLAHTAKGDLSARRYALKFLFDKKAIAKIFDLLIPKMKNKKSGFIKIYRLTPRKGDNAKRAIIMLDEQLQTVSTVKQPAKVKEKSHKSLKTKTAIKK